MEKNITKKYTLVDAIKIVIENWNRASIMQGAAEMAYYLLLSLVPILLVIANIIPLLPIDPAIILDLLNQAFPADIAQIIMPIVEGYLESGSGGAISIGLLASIWSASNVFSTLRRVLDEVYGTSATAKNNFIVARILSLLVMMAILGIVGAAVFVFVFGEQILGLITDLIGIQLPLAEQLLQLRWVALPLILFAVGLIIYDMVPNHHLTLKYAVPGTIFMLIGLLLLSQFFSLATQFMGGDAVANQTIGGFIVLMLFLYLANVVVLFGALINTLVFQLVTGESVLDHEKDITEKEQMEDAGYKGYPDYEESIVLKRKIYKIH